MRHDWESEVEMCQHLKAGLERLGFDVFPEANDFDLFAVANPETCAQDVEPGVQIGVEAKLQPNMRLLSQLASHRIRPHMMVAAVPRHSRDFCAIARALGIGVWLVSRRGVPPEQFLWTPRNPEPDLLPVPSLRIDVAPGSPAPKKFSEWKVQAVRLMTRLRAGETLTYQDFKDVGINGQRFRQMGWITATGGWRSGRKVWGLGPNAETAPDVQYPEIVAAIEAEAVS